MQNARNGRERRQRRVHGKEHRSQTSYGMERERRREIVGAFEGIRRSPPIKHRTESIGNLPISGNKGAQSGAKDQSQS